MAPKTPSAADRSVSPTLVDADAARTGPKPSGVDRAKESSPTRPPEGLPEQVPMPTTPSEAFRAARDDEPAKASSLAATSPAQSVVGHGSPKASPKPPPPPESPPAVHQEPPPPPTEIGFPVTEPAEVPKSPTVAPVLPKSSPARPLIDWGAAPSAESPIGSTSDITRIMGLGSHHTSTPMGHTGSSAASSGTSRPIQCCIACHGAGVLTAEQNVTIFSLLASLPPRSVTLSCSNETLSRVTFECDSAVSIIRESDQLKYPRYTVLEQGVSHRIFRKFSTTNARSHVARTLAILLDEGLHLQPLALPAQLFFEITGFLSIISRPYFIRCFIAMMPSLGLLTLPLLQQESQPLICRHTWSCWDRQRKLGRYRAVANLRHTVA